MIDDDLEEHTEMELISKEIKEKAVKLNAQKILNERNKYTFYGHIAEEALEFDQNKYASCLAFLLVKKAVEAANALNFKIKGRKFDGVTNWE